MYIQEAQYSDDVALFSNSAEGLQNLLSAYNHVSKETGLQINTSVSKTETMSIGTQVDFQVDNEYFVNMAQELKQSQTSSVSFDSSKLEEFVSSPFDNFGTQFNIPLFTVHETRKFIDNMSSSKATGADEISVKVLKLV